MGVFKDYIEEFYNTKIDLNEMSVHAYVQEVTRSQTEEFWEFVKNKNFYEKAPLFQDAKTVLEKLNKKYDVYIVTSYLWKETIDLSGNNLRDKYYYLKEMLPFVDPAKYIFTTNKSLMNFDIRIDDRLHNLDGAETKILFTAWHNKDIGEDELESQNVIRVDTWKDIADILL